MIESLMGQGIFEFNSDDVNDLQARTVTESFSPDTLAGMGIDMNTLSNGVMLPASKPFDYSKPFLVFLIDKLVDNTKLKEYINIGLIGEDLKEVMEVYVSTLRSSGPGINHFYVRYSYPISLDSTSLLAKSSFKYIKNGLEFAPVVIERSEVFRQELNKTLASFVDALKSDFNVRFNANSHEEDLIYGSKQLEYSRSAITTDSFRRRD